MHRLLTLGFCLLVANGPLSAQTPDLVVFLPWSPVDGTTVVDGQMLWQDSLETDGDTLILRQVVANRCNQEVRAQLRLSRDTLTLELRYHPLPTSPNLAIHGCEAFRTYEARIAPIPVRRYLLLVCTSGRKPDDSMDLVFRRELSGPRATAHADSDTLTPKKCPPAPA